MIIALLRAGFRLLASLSLILIGVPASADMVTPSERVRRSVVVRAGPDTATSAIGRLSPGDIATLEDEVPGWYRVRLVDGTIGYVSKAWMRADGQSFDLSSNAADAGPYRVHVIDVGTGLSIFVEGPGFTLLYDGGSQDDLADGADNRIIAYIRMIRPDVQMIDHLVLSHAHKDHVELLPDIFDRFVVRNVWDSGALNPTLGYCRFLKKVEAEAGVAYHDAIASGGVHAVTFSNARCSGTVHIAQASMMTSSPVVLGPGATMTVLYRDAAKHSDQNENSVVLRLDLGGRRLLLTGDAEAGERAAVTDTPAVSSVEAKLLSCCRADLRADVLVVGHHGSLTSSRRSFLDAVGAASFIVSSGPHPYRGVQLPDEAVLTELRSRGRLFSTKWDDDACAVAVAKVGPDADESPGGCTNVLVTISSGAIQVGLGRSAD